MSRVPPFEERKKIQIKRRLMKAFDSLVSRGIIENYEDLSRLLSTNTSTVRGAFSIASPYLSRKFVDHFLEVFSEQISREWLLEGEGFLRPKIEVTPKEATLERWKRVAYIINQENLTPQDFAREIGMTSPSTIYRTLQNKTRPSDNTMHLIYDRFPEYGRAWLFYGQGEAYIKPKVPQTSGDGVTTAEPYNVEATMTFPIIPDTAAAGRLSSYGDPDPDGLETITLPVDRTYRGNYYIFRVRGASMDDGTSQSLCDGDKILCREVARDYWSMGLHRRTWPYFVFATHSEGIIVKEVIEQDLRADTITCHSINPDYPDIILHLKDIVGIYNVVEIIGRSMRR